jgi:hypothetical protein
MQPQFWMQHVHEGSDLHTNSTHDNSDDNNDDEQVMTMAMTIMTVMKQTMFVM